MRNSDGRTTGYTYDEAGNLASITYADGRVVHYSYDKNDRLTKVTDNGKETVYTYDLYIYSQKAILLNTEDRGNT